MATIRSGTGFDRRRSGRRLLYESLEPRRVLATVSGAVYDDGNADGQRDATEVGLAGWTVFLDANQNGRRDAGEPSTQTLADDPDTPSVDEAGLFEFASLTAGTHVVFVVVPTQYLSTSSNPVSVSFVAGTETADVAFAVTTNDTTVRGFVFDDVDRNGLRGLGEEGVGDAIVYLDGNDNGSLDFGEPREITGVDGAYEFLNVEPGDQVVRAIVPRAYEWTLPADATRLVSLELDEVATDVNFGARYFGVDLSGVQFDDLNDNGVRDAGEPGLGGVVVFVDDNDNGFPDPGEVQTTSVADGTFSLQGINPGTMTVRSVSPIHYRPSATYPSRHRLFGISDLHSPAISTSNLVLTELDPDTGAVLGEFEVPQNATDETELTFDGQRLVLFNNEAHRLQTLAFDGATVANYELPSFPGPTVFRFGVASPVFVKGFLFLVTGRHTDELTLWRVHQTNGEVERLGAIRAEGLSGRLSIESAATVSPDGDAIILGTVDSLPGSTPHLEIDPFERMARVIDDVDPSRQELGLARLGEEVFAAYSGATSPDLGQINVFDSLGNAVRTLAGFPTQKGLAGGLYRDNAVTLTLPERTAIDTVEHAHFRQLASITGRVSQDENADGDIQQGEAPIQGVTVYVDLDRNGRFEPGEPFGVTDAGGTYSITGLVPDHYAVRQVRTSSASPFAVGQPITRLFLHATDDGSDIVQIDSETGEILKRFPSPVSSPAAMTLEDGSLYVVGDRAIFRLDADTGQIVSTIATTPGQKDAIEVRDGMAYMVNVGQETLDQFDLVRRRLLARLDLGVVNGGNAGDTLLDFTVGTSPEGDHFIIDTSEGIRKVDFRTGVYVPHTPQHSFPWAAYESAAGGEFFLGTAFAPNWRTRITEATSTYVIPGEIEYRTIISPIEGTVSGYGADIAFSDHHAVWACGGAVLEQIDFGTPSTTGTIRGVQFEDTDANGLFDVGEARLAGLTVFADLNANGFADAGEPQTTSGADGSYVLSDVPVGRNLIRAESPRHYRPTRIESVSDRLIGVQRVTNASSTTGYNLQIREIDPVDGQRIATIDTAIPVDQPGTAAFDGRRLIVIDNRLDVLIEVGLDGTLLDQVPLPGTQNFVFAPGPVVIDGTIYLVTTGGGMPLQLIRYDADSNQFHGAQPISRFIEPNAPNDPLPQLTMSVSASPDGESILAFSNIDDRVFVIDPLTARMAERLRLPRTAGGVWSAAAVGGELFVRGAGSQSNTDVYDVNYNLLRTMGNPATSGMGGGEFEDHGQSVTVTAGGTIGNLDFGHRSTQTMVSGRITRDLNRNRVADADEPPISSTRVFLDLNRNGFMEPEEPRTITDEQGDYSFEALPPGDYSVRVDAGMSSALTENDLAELYSIEANLQFGVQDILRVDPITGQVLRRFPAPSLSFTAGLARAAAGLFYVSDSLLQKLDPDTGQVLNTLPLPADTYGGLAAIGEMVFAVGAGGLLHRVDSNSMQIVESIDLNAVNASHPNAPFSFGNNLGETPDGARLLTRLGSGGGTLVIHPQTGRVEQRLPTNAGVFALSGAGDEVFRSTNGVIRTESIEEGFIRNVPDTDLTTGIAAAVLPGEEHLVRAAADVHHTGLDFFLQEVPSSTIAGILWDDRNADGEMNDGEDRLPDRLVYVDLNNNERFDEGEPTTRSVEDDSSTSEINERGWYRIDGVPSGHHVVRQVLPLGWVQTDPVTHGREISFVADNDYVPGENSGTFPFYDSAASDDGRYIAFSTARQLLAADANSHFDVYLIDRETNTLELVSVDDNDNGRDARSLSPAISADGNRIVFWSFGDFDSADDNGTQDIYLRDRAAGTTTLISKADPTIAGGMASGNSFSFEPTISADGDTVAFWSNATDLVPGDTNGLFDLFVQDLSVGVNERINLAPDGGEASGGHTHRSRLSAGGRFVTFWSHANNLVGDDTNQRPDVFLLDRQSGVTERVNVADGGEQANHSSFHANSSDDGRYVVFHSLATNLVDAPEAVGAQVFLKDRLTGDVRMVSRRRGGPDPNGASVMPTISGDGRWVVFHGWASNLVDGDDNGNADAFIFDRLNDEITLVTRAADGSPAAGRNDWARLSHDGSTITFNSNAADLPDPPGIPPDGPGYLYAAEVARLGELDFGYPVEVLVGQEMTGIDFGSRYAPVAPGSIVLSESVVVENLDTSVGDVLLAELTAVDQDTPSGHAFELVAGNGDVDNGVFAVIGSGLYLKQGTEVDFETKPSYSIRLRVTDVTGESDEETVEISVVDLLEIEVPKIGDGAGGRSRVDFLELAFDAEVEFDAGAFQLHRLESSDAVDFVTELMQSNGASVVRLTFQGSNSEGGGTLVDGNYRLTIDGTRVRRRGTGETLDADRSGAGGGIYRFGDKPEDAFFRFLGDSDGDRDVDGQDYGRFGSTFLLKDDDAAFDEDFDSDGDGDVDGQDYGRFGTRFQDRLAFPI